MNTIYIDPFSSHNRSLAIADDFHSRTNLFKIDNDKLMKIKQELQRQYIFTVESKKFAEE